MRLSRYDTFNRYYQLKKIIQAQECISTNTNSDMEENKDSIFQNLDKMYYHILEVNTISELCNKKSEKVKRERNLPLLEYTITLVSDYSQNLSLPYLRDKYSSETYYLSSLNLFIFSLVGVLLVEKLKAFIYTEVDRAKGRINVSLLIFEYLDKVEKGLTLSFSLRA